MPLGFYVRQPRQRNGVEPPANAVAVFKQAHAGLPALLLLQAPGTVSASHASTNYGYIEIHKIL
jgi:hypothetical protein